MEKKVRNLFLSYVNLGTRIGELIDEPTALSKATDVINTVVAKVKERAIEKESKTTKPSSTSSRKGDVDALELKLVETLAANPTGLVAEDLRKKIGLERGAFGILIRRAREKNLIRSEGEKRGTKYFPPTAIAPVAPASLTKVVRRRSADSTHANGVVAA